MSFKKGGDDNEAVPIPNWTTNAAEQCPETNTGSRGVTLYMPKEWTLEQMAMWLSFRDYDDDTDIIV